ncbi:hypothetical protein ANO14919_026130 [Xylariales sp. No.14919]|nr:hypothetical protein ANO14919_026130 [Xylariales sp. No.14919]
MDNRIKLDLKAFEISSKTFDLSLSVTSSAFIYDVPLRNTTQDHLKSLIQSKQLWLLPRGFCRLDVQVDLGECNVSREERDGFLEFIADTLCQSSIWSQLGLSVKFLHIQYHQEEVNIPNLYFRIEQPDMSSALLSPPHVHTAQFKGLDCVLRFKYSSRPKASSVREEGMGSEPLLFPGPINSLAGIPPDYFTLGSIDPANLRESVACLVEAAFRIILGTHKIMRGLKIIEPEKAPSLLDLAPTIWNSHYLRSIVNHAKNFALISNIFASSLKGQSPELRRKGEGLLQRTLTEVNNAPNHDSARHPEVPIQRMLWDLLQGTLKPTIGKKTARSAVSPKVESDPQDYDMGETMVDEGYAEKYYTSDDHYAYGTLVPPPSQGYHHYQNNANYNSDIVLSDDATPIHQDNQALGVTEFQVGMEYFHPETDTPSDRLFEPYSQHFESNLSDIMRDHVMSDYTYDEDLNIYDGNYHIEPTEQGFSGCDLAETTLYKETRCEDGIQWE